MKRTLEQFIPQLQDKYQRLDVPAVAVAVAVAVAPATPPATATEPESELEVSELDLELTSSPDSVGAGSSGDLSDVMGTLKAKHGIEGTLAAGSVSRR